MSKRIYNLTAETSPTGTTEIVVDDATYTESKKMTLDAVKEYNQSTDKFINLFKTATNTNVNVPSGTTGDLWWNLTNLALIFPNEQRKNFPSAAMAKLIKFPSPAEGWYRIDWDADVRSSVSGITLNTAVYIYGTVSGATGTTIGGSFPSVTENEFGEKTDTSYTRSEHIGGSSLLYMYPDQENLTYDGIYIAAYHTHTATVTFAFRKATKLVITYLGK